MEEGDSGKNCLHNVFDVTILTMFLLPFWALNVSFALLPMQGQKALRYHQKYFYYGFGTKWGWVINDRIFIFGWTIPLNCNNISQYSCFYCIFDQTDALVNIRDFFQKHTNLINPKLMNWALSCWDWILGPWHDTQGNGKYPSVLLVWSTQWFSVATVCLLFKHVLNQQFLCGKWL